MHDNALKELWRAQSIEPAPALPSSTQLAEMAKRVSSLNRTLFWRDCRENIAALFVLACFGVYFFIIPAPLARVGSVIVILWSLLVMAYPIWRKRRVPKAAPDASMMESLECELRKVEVEIGLLRSILWWYILPGTVGVMLFVAGLGSSLTFKIVFALVVIALDAFIYWLNQVAVDKRLLPLKKELQSLLHSIETGEPFDETQIADFSAGARSSPANDGAERVEFKVAFWQIALFGEIGFVGIWFFGMLAWTDFDVPRMFLPQHLIWIVPCFLAGLLYSWILQKTTECAVGISASGVHLSKGQTLISWEDIKEVRPFRFLHVRNLRLIRRSGEMSLMHWTPLERHSELRAAVEAFAPENHPIREYLSLLRPEKMGRKSGSKTILLSLVLFGVALAVLLGFFSAGAQWGTKGVLRGNAVTKETPARNADAEAPLPAHDSARMSQMLETIRAKHKFPALAAAVVVDGKIVGTSAVGFRKHGGTEAATANDKFHIGSVTKSMTATLAAMLVEQGKIAWTTTIGESFPELAERLHADYRSATLEQLLAHRGGAPGSPPTLLWLKAWDASGSPAEQRLDFVKGILARKPEAKPGTRHIYSNQGYAIAGVMLEKAAGKSWEELLRTMLFEPLGMTSAGFGAPATPGKVDQPWGHTKGLLRGMDSVPPGPKADNPPAIGPAGTVHCSLADLAKYAAFHLSGERGGSKLLNGESFKKLHTSTGDDYALGWVVLEREWAGGRALMHNGSNTMFYIVVWMAPEKDCAVIVATNVGVDPAAEGCDEAAGNLIRQFILR